MAIPKKFRKIDINEIIHNDDYKSFVSTLEEWVLEDISRRSEEIIIELGPESFNASIGSLLFNILLFSPFRKFGYNVGIENWFDGDPKKDLPRYFDKLILFFENEDPTELNVELADVIMNLSALASRVNLRVATTISTYEIRKAMDDNPRLREIAESSFGHIDDFRKIEKAQDDMMKEAEVILRESDTALGDIIRAGAVNVNQLKQILVGLGPKSDLSGHLVSHLPDTNFLRGMKSIEDYYTIAESGRKVIITSHRSVRQSGYLTRKLSLLAINTELDWENQDCGTEHVIEIEVTSSDMLRRFRGRWCVLEPDNEDCLPFIITDDHEDLVGRKIYVRSPMTCAGEKVCKTCYGQRASVNRNLHIGIVAVLHLTSQLTQKLLSAKHLVQTKSPELDWPTLFQKLFVIDRTTVMISDDAVGWVVFQPESITEDDETGDKMIEQISIDIPIKGGKRGDKETKILDLPIPLFLTEEFTNEINCNYRNPDGTFEINLKELPDMPAFTIRLQNQELTTSLNKIKALIERKDHDMKPPEKGSKGSKKKEQISDDECEDKDKDNECTIDEIVQRMMELLVSNEIELDAVHAEVILRNMVRLKSDLSLRPDFSSDDPGEYTILRLVDAILQSPSIIQSLSFQDIRRQLMDVRTYSKSGSSLLDPLFGG